MDRILNISWRTGLCTVVLSTMLTAQANARGLQADGCEQLANVVQSQVETVVAARQFGDSNGSRLAEVPQGIVGCGTATAVASKAFGAAFDRFGINVEWNNGLPPDPGDYCLGHRLEQCYPDGGGMLTGFPPGAIQDSWRAVTLSLQRQMPLGDASDIVYFSPVVLRETLATSLRLVVKPRYDAPPDCPAPFGPCRIY